MALIPLSGIMVQKIGAKASTVCWIVLSAIGSTCFIWARHPLMSVVATVVAIGGMAAWRNSLSVISMSNVYWAPKYAGAKNVLPN